MRAHVTSGKQPHMQEDMDAKKCTQLEGHSTLARPSSKHSSCFLKRPYFADLSAVFYINTLAPSWSDSCGQGVLEV